jgi:HAD superfamily hydrolase (TIGR01509 family)
MGRVVDDFVDGYRSRMFRAFEAGVEPIPGARATLEALDRASVRWCVASNGPHSKMRASLSAASLLDLTGELEVDGTRVFSAYDVNRWKPEPELFLHAASSMRAAPGASVVVEDSTSGVEAAVRAGIPCVAYADLTSAEDLSAAGAAVVVRSMGDVPAVLGLS